MGELCGTDSSDIAATANTCIEDIADFTSLTPSYTITKKRPLLTLPSRSKPAITHVHKNAHAYIIYISSD